MLSTSEPGKAGSPPPGAKPTEAAVEETAEMTLAPLALDVAPPSLEASLIVQEVTPLALGVVPIALEVAPLALEVAQPAKVPARMGPAAQDRMRDIEAAVVAEPYYMH